MRGKCRSVAGDNRTRTKGERAVYVVCNSLILKALEKCYCYFVFARQQFAISLDHSVGRGQIDAAGRLGTGPHEEIRVGQTQLFVLSWLCIEL